MTSAASVPITVKWGKETIQLNLIPANGVTAFKVQLEEMTGVPQDRMKVMPKSKGLWKGLLKDSFDLTSIDYSKIKSPIEILLMGSAATLTGPSVKTIFVEDLPPEEAAKVAAEPSGLNNLGNTCYLNSVVQCLRAIPTLRSALNNYTISNNSASSNGNGFMTSSRSSNNGLFVSSLRDLYKDLDKTADAVSPLRFVTATKMTFPHFAQTGSRGEPMQQDAEEFYSGLLTVASQEMSGLDIIKKSFPDGVNEESLNGADNLVDALFGIKMEETLTCDELSPAAGAMDVDGDSHGLEPAVVKYDLHRKLVCNIQGGSDSASQTNVTHIMEGIDLALNGKVEKRSEILGRDALWTRKQRIARLPPVLVVQFGRFYWKETPDSQDHAGVKCKVMKPVAFQGTLDVYEFCSAKIQKVLKKVRDKAIADEEDRIAKKLKGQTNEETNATDSGDSKMADNNGEDMEDEDLKAALALSLAEESDPELNTPVGPGLPAGFQGKYELFAVVTHKGRDADGGHYMGWVKAESQGDSAKIADTDEANDDWFVFDDDGVSPCKTEDVLKLKGGGDWHMSYLNFYRAKK